MSIGLILSKIGFYIGEVPVRQREVDDIQTQLYNAGTPGAGGNKAAIQELQKQFANAKYKLQLAQEFLTFWKDQLTAAIALIKSLQEIGQGVR